MTLYTNGLQIIALDTRELKLLIEDIPELENRLGISYKAEPITGIFKKIVAGQLEKAESDADNYLWYTFWLIVRTSDKTAVGSADFKGAPDEEGNVEIGYGLAEQFEHNGYMTQTVTAMCDWAHKNGAKAILAFTEPGNLRSQAVLERSGFKYARDSENMPLYVKIAQSGGVKGN